MNNRLRAICDKLPWTFETSAGRDERTRDIVLGLGDLAALGRRAQKALDELERSGSFRGLAPYLKTNEGRIDQLRLDAASMPPAAELSPAQLRWVRRLKLECVRIEPSSASTRWVAQLCGVGYDWEPRRSRFAIVRTQVQVAAAVIAPSRNHCDSYAIGSFGPDHLTLDMSDDSAPELDPAKLAQSAAERLVTCCDRGFRSDMANVRVARKQVQAKLVESGKCLEWTEMCREMTASAKREAMAGEYGQQAVKHVMET
jgi:hypothetical protein